MTDTAATPMDRFIEQMGLFAQTEGAPRIAGLILGYLIVEGEPRTLTQMAAALDISKASASTNARLLERKGALQRVSTGSRRGDAYQALDMPNTATIRAVAQRYRDHADTIGAIAARFPQGRAAARDRVVRYSGFYRETAEFVEAWMDEMESPAERPAGKDTE